MAKHKHDRDGEVPNNDVLAVGAAGQAEEATVPQKLGKKFYEKELTRLSFELVKLQYWVIKQGVRVVVLFEGRDAAGKGGTDQAHHRAAQSARRAGRRPEQTIRRERTQWYFQRYVAHLPAAGEIVLFDRSWYNRAGVERVMGFCTDDGVRGVPALVPRVRAHAGALGDHPAQVLVIGQRRGAGAALPGARRDPPKRWKLSPMDLESREQVGRVLQGQGHDVPAHRHPGGAAGIRSSPTTSAAPG